MYSVGNTANNYVISLYGDIIGHIVVIILKPIDIRNHYVMHQELTWCCMSVIFQKQT